MIEHQLVDSLVDVRATIKAISISADKSLVYVCLMKLLVDFEIVYFPYAHN